jgi:hypothetical protein
VNALLLIAASVPLFSLVFFFGGVSPVQLLLALLVYVVTTLLIGTFGLLCSTFIARPAVSTVVTYLGGVIWIIAPLIIAFILSITGALSGGQGGQSIQYLFAWNPVYALISTYVNAGGLSYNIGGLGVPIWVPYVLISLVATVLFFFLSMLTVRSTGMHRPSNRVNRRASTAKGQVTA